MDRKKDWVWDIETYKSAFTFSIIRADGKFPNTFEVSHRVNEIDRIFACLDYLRDNDCRMVGFNSAGFDYPIIHKLLEKKNSLPKTGKGIASLVHKLAQEQIESFKDGFGNSVKTEERYVPQVDLFRIHHMNNKAKATSLKMIEFNMRNETIEDLPFPVDMELNGSQIDTLKKYNAHDVYCTLKFYDASESQIQFRDDLSLKLGKDFTNADDTKIGSDYFQMELEKSGLNLYKYKDGKRVMKQTKRDKISLNECLFSYYDFSRVEFKAVQEWFSKQVITETKGVFSDVEEHDLGELAKYSELTEKKKRFKIKPSDKEVELFKKEHPLGWVEEEELKATEYLLDSKGDFIFEHTKDEFGNIDFTKKPKKVRVPKKSYWGCWKVAETLNVVIDGFRFDFGVGGIHGSVSDKVISENKGWKLIDHDFSSFYPNMAISNRIYPEHLSEKFCDIYKDMYDQRKSYPKASSENAMLKLALNGTYGKSNDKCSVFYDPKFTMSITVNGQLTLCLLIDMWYRAGLSFKIIQCNTDGVTIAVKRNEHDLMQKVMDELQALVKLTLESVEYSKMAIRDVNSYLAVYTNGKVKRKGAYQYEGLGWHQNHSSLVIPMAAEAQMLQGIPVSDFIENHAKNPDNKWDFMLRTKVPRSSKLYMVMEDGTEIQQQNICRYYPCKTGGKLVKVMPPLEEGGELRRLSLDKEWNVKTCNNIEDFGSDIDLDYYISKAEKLLIQ